MSKNTWTLESGPPPYQDGLALGNYVPKPNSVNPTQPNELPHAANLLRKAFGIGEAFEGALRVHAKALRAITAAQVKWPTQKTERWIAASKLLTDDIVTLRSQPDATSRLRRDGGIPQVQTWDAIHVNHLPSEKASQIEAFLGRAVLQSAGRQEAVSVRILDAARLLVASFSRIKSPLNDLLMTVNLCEAAELAEYDARAKRSDYLRDILATLQRVASEPILPPPVSGPTSDPVFVTNHCVDPRAAQTIDEVPSDKQDQQPKEPSSPTIGARLHTASLAPYQTALGLTHRDFIPPEDFRKAINHLSLTFEQSDGATLCLLSCVMCTEDTQLLQVQLSRQGDVWIEPNCEAWGWNFAQYRNSGARPVATPTVEPILIAFPPALSRRLKELCQKTPTATGVKDLFSNEAPQLLKQAREVANQLIPSTEHAIYRGRLSKSWSLYLLHITGSDMAVAMLTAQFWFTAPAALFYYNPLRRELLKRLSRAYQSIGLGDLPPIAEEEMERVNTTSIVETSTMRSAIHLLAHRASAPVYSSGVLHIETANLAMASLACMFVLLTGHRASKLDKLNYGALAGHPSLMLIDDKVIEDETHRNHPRVLCKTQLVNWILHSAYAIRERLNPSPQKHADPVFLHWTSLDKPPSAIATASIAQSIYDLLGTEFRANCARAWWVTEFDHLGADRWLVRTLTGHAREVTRVGGLYVSAPIVNVIAKLELLMERIQQETFALNMTATPFSVQFRSEARPRAPKTVSNKDEPSAILPPIDEKTLIDAANFKFVRQTLLAKPPSEVRNAIAFMSAVVLDGVPDLTACIDIALVKPTQKIGSTACASRHREHFVHAFQFPAPIAELWVRDSSEVSPADLVEQLHQVAGELNLPLTAKGASILQAVFDLGVAHRRLSLSPWLSVISLEHFPSVTLSESSLHALTGVPSKPAQPITTARNTQVSLRKVKESSLEFLSKTLLECTDTTVRMGEEIRRAQLALTKIEEDQSQIFTPKSRALKDWVIHELKGAILSRSGKYALSSLYTYFLALARAIAKVDACECIEDWDSDAWNAFVIAGSTDQNFRDACAALLRSLQRRGVTVPNKVLVSQGESPTNAPRDSSSSSLVTDRSLLVLKDLILQKYQQTPLAFARQMLRFEISIANPVRGSEPGSLTQNSLLDSGALTIRRQGYSVHKSDGAIRLQFLSPEAFERIKALASEICHLNSNGRFLLKGHGTPEEGLIDEVEQEDFNQLIKIATNNPRARTHSLRAATLQNLLTPDWQRIAGMLLMGGLDSPSASRWFQSLRGDDVEWLVLGKAIAAAGHADLRSALGYYLANWPLLIAIAACADLTECHPSHQFLLGIGLKPNTLRAARSRHQSKDSGTPFCEWHWIRQATLRPPEVDKRPPAAPVRRTRRDSDATEDVIPALSSQVLRYLVLRGLGLDKDLAATQACIRRVDANCYDHLAIPLDEISNALRRGRGDTGARAVSATIQMVVSNEYDGYFSALLTLAKPDVHAVRGLLGRSQTQSIATHISGIRTLARILPSNVVVVASIGSTYMNALNPLLADKKIRVQATPKLGGTPAVGLLLTPSNLVVGARLLGFIRIVFAQLSLIHDQVSNNLQ